MTVICDCLLSNIFPVLIHCITFFISSAGLVAKKSQSLSRVPEYCGYTQDTLYVSEIYLIIWSLNQFDSGNHGQNSIVCLDQETDITFIFIPEILIISSFDCDNSKCSFIVIP